MRKFSGLILQKLYSASPYAVTNDSTSVSFYPWSGVDDWFTNDIFYNTPNILEKPPIMTRRDYATNPAAQFDKSEYFNGCNWQIFFCDNIPSALTSLRIGYTTLVWNPYVVAYRFRNLDVSTVTEEFSAAGYPLTHRVSYKSPFNMQFYGTHDTTVKADAYVPVTTPGTLPTYTFSRNNGQVMSVCMAASDADSVGGDQTKAFESMDAPGGGVLGVGNSAHRAATVQSGYSTPNVWQRGAYTSRAIGTFSAGTTRGINPQWHNYDSSIGSSAHVYGNWKTSLTFGLESADGNSINSQIGIYSNGSSEFNTTSFLCDSTNHSIGDIFPLAAGDAVLLFAFCNAFPYIL